MKLGLESKSMKDVLASNYTFLFNNYKPTKLIFCWIIRREVT